MVVTNRFLSLYEMPKTQNTQHNTEEQTVLVTLTLILKWVRVSPPLCSTNLDVKKLNLDTNLTLFPKVKLKWIIDLNAKLYNL